MTSGRGPGGGSRDADRDVEDYWLGGRQGGSRASDSQGGSANPGTGGNWQQPAFTPARRDPSHRDRDPGHREPATRRPGDQDRVNGRDPGNRDWRQASDDFDPRDGYRASKGAGNGRDAPTMIGGRDASRAASVAPSRTGLLATPLLRWVGSWPTPWAVLVLLGAALLGLIGTVVADRDPGFLIGFLLIAGSVVAAIGARRAVHRLIPLPALCYIVATFAAGYVHDQANLATSKEFDTSFLSWVGSAFFALVWATVLVIAIAFGRWLMSKRLVSRMLPAASSGSGRAAPGSAGSDPWGDRDPRGAVNPRAVPDSRNSPGTGSFRDSRSPRDPQDPWGQRDSRDSDRGRRGESGPWDSPPRQGGAGRTGGNRGQYGGRDHDANDTWGTSAPDNASWPATPTRNARDSRDGRGLRDGQDPLDGREARDGQSQRRYGDSRNGVRPRDERAHDDRARDSRRSRPADGPRDIW